MTRGLAYLALIVFVASSPIRAELRLPGLFSDHMVLQRDAPAVIWGWAEPGEKVTVHLGEQKREASADDRGYWRLELGPSPAGGPHVMHIQAEDRITVEDVYFGDVWLCGGQSNMDRSVGRSKDAEATLSNADLPELRLFKVPYGLKPEPANDIEARWHRCTPESAQAFSAVAFYFGRSLQQELDVPVGLILSSYGGTPIEGWMSERALRADDAFLPILDRADRAMAAYLIELHQWQNSDRTAPRPDPPRTAGGSSTPSHLFNAMIHPLAPYTLRGAVWYQGESNVWRAEQYGLLLRTMIRDWRMAWGDADLPFGIVQLPNYVDPGYPPAPASWPELRAAQAAVAQDDPHTGLVVTIDIGDPTDIHPRNKAEVGRRLAQWALATVYDRDVIHTGPVFRSMSVIDGEAIIRFDLSGSNLATRDGGSPRGFVVAGADHRFRWASAQVRGEDTVAVWHPKISDPVAVRYAWHENPDWANLTNREGMPAGPFRTDHWPGVTTGRR